MAILKAQPDLSVFDGQLQHIGLVGQLVTLDRLAYWLLQRTLENGAARQAVEDLSRYVVESHFSVLEVFALAGVVPVQAADLAPIRK